MNDPLLPMRPWTGVRAGVLGLGRSGRGAVRLLRRHGAEVVGLDDRADASVRDFLAAEGARAVGTGDAEGAVRGLEVLVVSPGIASSHPVVRAAEARGCPTIGELELASRCTEARIVAVTGTNGKSTTVSLVHAMLEAAGRRSALAGNIGTALSDEVESMGAGDWLVAECSSFQLERITHFHPRVAVVLNLAPDHLDRYASFEDYGEAKRNLLRNLGPEDHYVFPVDDPVVAPWAEKTPARRAGFSAEARSGASAWIEDGHFVRRGPDGGGERVLALEDFSLLGAHNRLNALAAIAVGTACGLGMEPMAAVLRSFAPLAHRAVPVPSTDGLTWIDDSKATNVHAASATLAGLDRPVVVLLGGRGKGEDYAPLRAFSARLRAAVCYGEEGPALARALEGATTVERVGTMRDALDRAAGLAQTGDVVLLSPACASFDEFSSFEERGEVFAAWVREHRKGAQ